VSLLVEADRVTEEWTVFEGRVGSPATQEIKETENMKVLKARTDLI
jgi:hypothetical protein